MPDSVYRVTEIIGVSSESWEAAARNAIETASATLRDLRIAEVIRQDLTVDEGKVTSYRVRLGISVQVRPGAVVVPELQSALVVTEGGAAIEAGHPSSPRSWAVARRARRRGRQHRPGPFAAMLLADLGAEVIRLDRVSSGAASGVLAPGPWNVLHRGRPSVGIDLERPEARELVLRLCESADVLVEGFRPGVMERLGLVRPMSTSAARSSSTAG